MISRAQDHAGEPDRRHPDAFRTVVATQQTSLVHLAHALCGDWATAEDCVAEAFARVWPHWSRGEVSDVEHYLRRAVINQVASRQRRNFRERLRLARLERPSEALLGPDQRAADADWIRHALLALPLAQRQVVVLRYLEDRSEAEVSDLLGVAVGTIKSRLARALQALRVNVQEDEEDHVGP